MTPDNTVAPQVIGWREWVGLPELGIHRLKAKIDTGARTSALHAFSLDTYAGPDGREWVRFGMHPRQGSTSREVYCEAPVLDRRVVTDSGGHSEERLAIETLAILGKVRWRIELTLTARDTMRFRMLLGRTAMNDRFLVNPALSYVCGKRRRDGS